MFLNPGSAGPGRLVAICVVLGVRQIFIALPKEPGQRNRYTDYCTGRTVQGSNPLPWLRV